MDRNRDVFFCHEIQAVALRKESVDRNKQIITLKAIDERRSPQGERG